MTKKPTSGVAEWTDTDDAPALTEAFFDAAEIRRGEALVRRGRPSLAQPKKLVSLRRDQAVVEHFRAGGEGWQSRINQALRKAAGL